MKYSRAACNVTIRIFCETQVSQRMFVNRTLRGIFAAEREEITGKIL
jgi:hypothetical protein